MMWLLVLLCVFGYLAVGVLFAVGLNYWGANDGLELPAVYLVLYWVLLFPVAVLVWFSDGCDRLVGWILTKLPGRRG